MTDLGPQWLADWKRDNPLPPTGEPLFHGTSRSFSGAVLPNNVHNQGKLNTPTAAVSANGQNVRNQATLDADETLRNRQAFATREEPYAWDVFAHRTANRGGGRGKVLKVSEQPDQAEGAFGREVVADKFPIEGENTIKPGHQGTLDIDWRPYVADGREIRDRRPQYYDAMMRGSQALDGVTAFNPASGVASDQFANHPSPGMDYVENRARGIQERADQVREANAGKRWWKPFKSSRQRPPQSAALFRKSGRTTWLAGESGTKAKLARAGMRLRKP